MRRVILGVALVTLMLSGCSTQMPAVPASSAPLTSTGAPLDMRASNPGTPSAGSSVSSLPSAPLLVGLPLAVAQSRAGSEGIALSVQGADGPSLQPDCQVLQQMPGPGSPLQAPVVQVIVQCRETWTPPSPSSIRGQ